MTHKEPKIREQILALLARKDYRPLDKSEIARKIGISGKAGARLRKTLRELERTALKLQGEM